MGFLYTIKFGNLRLGIQSLTFQRTLMSNGITREALLEYLYNEVSEEKRAAIISALSNNWELNEELLRMQEVKTELETVSYSPSKASIANIMEYAIKSRATNPTNQE